MADDSICTADMDPSLVTGYKGTYNRYVKRCMDFILALILVIILSPVFLIVSLAIVADSGRPVFYRAWRGGYRRQNFRIFKFRIMVQGADRIGGGTTALQDSRITCVGGFLRKVKMDEFANLLSILRGNMSFVGPRPELADCQGKDKKIFEQTSPL